MHSKIKGVVLHQQKITHKMARKKLEPEMLKQRLIVFVENHKIEKLGEENCKSIAYEAITKKAAK